MRDDPMTVNTYYVNIELILFQVPVVIYYLCTLFKQYNLR